MRTKLTVACALTALFVCGGGTAGATGLIHIQTIANAAGVQKTLTPKATHTADRSRGGQALTQQEYWRAQWRNEGAVYPGDK